MQQHFCIEKTYQSINEEFDFYFNNVAGFVITDYTGANQSFVTQGSATGAGDGATVPDWATDWTRF